MNTNLLFALHRLGEILVVPNVWDAASARCVSATGAKVIATTSAGVSWSMGYQDGERVSVPEYLQRIKEIRRQTALPLSVDFESGYTNDLLVLTQYAHQLLDLGVAGINIEDGVDDARMLARKIETIAAVGAMRNQRLFVNARTDVYLHDLAAPDHRVSETLHRAAMYRQAGANGLFVPLLAEREDIALIVPQCGLPLNVMLTPELPSLTQLRQLGVQRVSAGPWLARKTFAMCQQYAQVFANGEVKDAWYRDALSFDEMNQ